jgi:hypothetical protein
MKAGVPSSLKVTSTAAGGDSRRVTAVFCLRRFAW